MTTPIRLSPADHCLIHAVCALLSDNFVFGDRPRDDAMIQSVLRDVLFDVTDDNPALHPFIDVASELSRATADQLKNLRPSMQAVVRDYHRRKLGNAWDMIRDRYSQADPQARP